jgi:hypothetical protein
MHAIKSIHTVKKQRGAVIIIFALCLFLLIGLAAFAIDFGYLYTTRSELQNVADAAALAGARYLGAVYMDLDPSQMATYEFSINQVYALAIEAVATQNQAARKSISIDINDVVIGLWDPEKSTDDIWYETTKRPDAVRVIARRDSTSINGAISTFLGRIFGKQEMDVVSEKAIAALTGPSTVEEAEVNAPFGISSLNPCLDPIQMRPTQESCAGWHNFIWGRGSASDSDMATIALSTIKRHVYDNNEHFHSSGETWLSTNFPALDLVNLDRDFNRLIQRFGEVPELYETGDEFIYTGGTHAALFNGSFLDPNEPYDGDVGTITGKPENSPASFLALFDYFRFRDDDGDDTVWTTIVPVYKEIDGCSNPGGFTEIAGFTRIVITMPVGQPDSHIEIAQPCELVVIQGRGSGTTYGNLRGAIPNLVR